MVFLSFHSFLKRIKIFSVFLLCEEHKEGFSMWDSPWISFVTVPLLKKHTRSLNYGFIWAPAGGSLLPEARATPTPALRLSGPQHCQQISPHPRHVFTAGDPLLMGLSSGWDWTQYPVLDLWSLCVRLALEPSTTPGQLVWDLWIQILVFTLSPAQAGLPLEGWRPILRSRCPILSHFRSLWSWFRKVEIIIEKKGEACACGSGPRVPYLRDVSMFPRRWWR